MWDKLAVVSEKLLGMDFIESIALQYQKKVIL